MADKLKDGDVVDQKLRSWIVNEIESINLKLGAGAKSDLGASLSTLKEGFILLKTVLVKDQSCEDSTKHRTRAVKRKEVFNPTFTHRQLN